METWKLGLQSGACQGKCIHGVHSCLFMYSLAYEHAFVGDKGQGLDVTCFQGCRVRLSSCILDSTSSPAAGQFQKRRWGNYAGFQARSTRDPYPHHVEADQDNAPSVALHIRGSVILYTQKGSQC